MRLFRGWLVLGGSFINTMLVAGSALYAYSLFVTAVETEFNLNREQANYGILTLYISMMIWAVLVGRWLERYSARNLSILGGLSFGLGYVLIATAIHPLMIIVAIALPLGFGFTASGPFIANALATRWFTKMRGRALGIAAIATSAGGFLIVPIVAILFKYFGWRGATLIIGASVALLVVFISFSAIISRPEDVNLLPDGDSDSHIFDTEENTLKNKPTTKRFINRAEFWLIALGTGLLLGSDQALLVSLVPYVEGQGYSKVDASYVLTVLTGSAIAGKFAVGWLAERYDKRLLFSLVCASNIAFLVAVLMYPSYQLLLVVAAFVGLAIGGVYPVWTTLTAQCFGRNDFPRVIGAMNLITVPCTLISISIAGRTFVKTGNYDLAFKIFIVQVILAAVIVWGLRLVKKS